MGNLVVPAEIHTTRKRISSSGSVCSGAGWLKAVLIYTDGTNNPTFTVYDNSSAASGTILLGPQELDATTKVLQGFSNILIHFANGLYIDITCSGTVYFDFYYRLKGDIERKFIG